LIAKLAEYAPLDAAADQMGAEFVHACLPPIISHNELQWSDRGRGRTRKMRITGECDVRTVSRRIARLVVEEGLANVYYTADNSLVPHGEPETFISFTLDDAPGIECVIQLPCFALVALFHLPTLLVLQGSLALASMPSSAGGLDHSVRCL
jgi:hypothetical protein